ncbi:hypothetical protein Goarm_001135 [Gossypium armourianum]|uniref:C3H1-type domain-containing protein n=1 Tax=Gossypium armourianum TaxID=34283 RepID=A0A7J9KCL8_9ROSI|nr:hypothetical protein [Gossypium armourianum]
MMVSLRGSPIYQTVPSPTTPGQQSYPGGITNWSRASFIPNPRWQGPSSYASLILPQGMVSVPGWNAYSHEISSILVALREPRIKSDGSWIKPWRSQVGSRGASPGLVELYCFYGLRHLRLAGNVLGQNLSTDVFSLKNKYLMVLVKVNMNCRSFFETVSLIVELLDRKVCMGAPSLRMVKWPRLEGSKMLFLSIAKAQGQLASVSSSENLQQTNVNHQIHGTSRQNESATAGSQASFSELRSGSVPVGVYALQRENVFPERPGEPECQFYMKTGDCKFGAVCKFHHPRERVLPAPDCVLSPIGLPLRPGEPLCIFYSRYGICKFGPSCKFNHPMGIFTYNYSPSSPSDAPVHCFLGSSSGTAGLNLSSEGLVEAVPTKPRRLSLSKNRQLSPSDDDIDAEG